ncbi:transposase family protein [Terrilactibacillus tamarindi]|uniref:transposase family protein n=1 Tax=Terrilactibacillus tamarindi TaxID=2599694 RepID=UPI002E2F0D27|nr:transposase family protein [Terrilactibacillus tamarindi]
MKQKNERFLKKYTSFEAALAIESPWYISNYEFDHQYQALHIFLDFHRGSTFTDAHCGHPLAKVYDIVDEDQTWQHLDFWQFKTVLHARLPRVECGICGKVRDRHRRMVAKRCWFYLVF